MGGVRNVVRILWDPGLRQPVSLHSCADILNLQNVIHICEDVSSHLEDEMRLSRYVLSIVRITSSLAREGCS